MRASSDQNNTPVTTTLQGRLDRERKACIRKALVGTSGDKNEAARRLDISRATLYRELRCSPRPCDGPGATW